MSSLKRPARVIVAVCTVVSFSICGAAAQGGQTFPRDNMLLPYTPAAMAEGPSAMRFNPAALSVQNGMALNYYHGYTDTDFPPDMTGDDALYFSAEGFGMSVEWLGAGVFADGRAYSAGFSSGARSALRWGTSYQWRSSDDPVQNKSHFWTHGVLYQPTDWLSLAAVAHNHNRMKVDGIRSDAEFVYSAAVQMLDGSLRVGGDWMQTTSQRVADGTYRLAASWEASDGLTMFADIDENENYSLGGRLNLTQLIAGMQASFDNKQGHQAGVMYAGLHEARRRPFVRVEREVVRLDIGGTVPDRKPPRQLFGRSEATTLDWLTLLERAAADPVVGAVVITLDDPEMGWARLDEVRHGIARLRDAGKYTVVYVNGRIGNGEYYVASAADLIVAGAVSSVELVGLRAEVTFARRLLDKLGITADFERVGDYKTASDFLTRTSMSDEHRETVNRLLDDFDTALVDGVAAGRGVTPEIVRGWIAHGPYVSIDAQDAGMLDRIAYPDELREIVSDEIGRVSRWVDGREFAGRVYYDSEWGDPPRVAVIFAEGSIRDGKDRSDWTGGVMGSESVGRAIRQAREDQTVDAIVLRVNSGGGEIVASDAIWREMQRTVGRKPLIVSFADVAASGGYYIACLADSIFAMPNTITGSIGVLYGKLDLSGLYDKVGLDREVVTRGRYANLFGSSQTFDDEERAVVREYTERAYERFIEVVAEGRGLPVDSVDAIGQGRVWSGTAAQRLGLVDRFADLHDAITAAARMAGVRPGQSVAVEVLPDPEWRLFSLSGMGLTGIDLTGNALASLATRALGLSNDDTAYEMPFTITIR